MDVSAVAPTVTATVANLTLSLAPAFTAGLAVQRALQILESIVPGEFSAALKRALGGLISLALGMYFAFGADIHTLAILQPRVSPWIDGLVTGLIVSAGTESVNSIVKFLGYSKESAKAQATVQKHDAMQQTGQTDNLALVNN